MHKFMAKSTVSGSDTEDIRSRKLEKTSFVNTRSQSLCRLRLQTRNLVIVVVIVAGLTLILVSQLWSHSRVSESTADIQLLDISDHSVIINKNLPLRETNHKCRFHSCFDVYRCGYNERNLLSVYIFPLSHYKNEKGGTMKVRDISEEFCDLLRAIKNSNYYTSDINKACIIVPSIDTLNQNGLNLHQTAKILGSLPR